MATYNRYVTTNATSYAGTNCAAIAATIVANTPGLALYYTATSTTTAFEAFYSVFGLTDVLLQIKYSGSYLYFYTLYKDPSGSTTVNGEKYNTTSNWRPYGSFGSKDNTLSFYSVVVDDAALVFGTAEGNSCFFKVKNVDSGAVNIVMGNFNIPSGSYHMYAVSNESRATASFGSVLGSSADTGYIRAVPIYASAELPVPVAGYVTNPNTLYFIYANGTMFSALPGTELSVGGSSFVSLGNQAHYIFIRVN